MKKNFTFMAMFAPHCITSKEINKKLIKQKDSINIKVLQDNTDIDII